MTGNAHMTLKDDIRSLGTFVWQVQAGFTLLNGYESVVGHHCEPLESYIIP